MNRQMKRAQERAERAQKGGSGNSGDAGRGGGTGGGTGGPPKRPTPGAPRAPRSPRSPRKRTGARQFLREVRQELKKVDWPTRKELVTYTVVVLVTITALTTYVFGLDSVFARLFLSILK